MKSSNPEFFKSSNPEILRSSNFHVDLLAILFVVWGVLTMLIGLMLVDFPGKRRLEQRLVARPGVLETMNRVRAWLGRPPLVR